MSAAVWALLAVAWLVVSLLVALVLGPHLARLGESYPEVDEET